MSMESPQFENTPEEVKESALRYKGEIFTGFLHVYALDKLDTKYPNWQKDGGKVEDGFITTKGRFVDRDEADKLAHEKLDRESRQT